MTWSGFQPSTNGFCHLRIVTKNFWQVWDFLFWGLYTEPINWPLLACSRSWCRVWSSVLGASHNWIFPCRGCENVCVRSGGVKKRVYLSSCPGFTCLLHGKSAAPQLWGCPYRCWPWTQPMPLLWSNATWARDRAGIPVLQGTGNRCGDWQPLNWEINVSA